MKYTKSLKGSINFKRVLKQGKYASGDNIAIYVKPTRENNDQNYFGICVSKKHGNSVVRNKLKRWARESYYTYENDIKKNNSIIVLYKKNIPVESLDYSTINDEIKKLFSKIGLLHG